jgi:hypothetical protein
LEPRKKSKKNRKSTNFPPEYLQTLNKLFAKAFKKNLSGFPIYVEGRILSDEVLLSVGFKPDSKGLSQINFEASVDHNGTDVFTQVGLSVDAISSMMEHYFKTGQKEDLPKIWTPFPIGKEKVYLQISARNTQLEKEADLLLGIDPNDALHKEHEPDDEDPLLLDEDDDPSETKH